MDYMFQAKHAVRNGKSSDEDTTKYIGVVARFCLGRSYAVYQRALMHDPEFLRLDTVFELREVLKDCQKNFEFINKCTETQREHSYWATYNTMVLILRICRRLRSNGFAYVCIPSLAFGAASLQTTLPLLANSFPHFRVRVLMELALSYEAADQLLNAEKTCLTAIEQVKGIKVMHLKVSFWLGKITAEQLLAEAKDTAPE